jgi:hypothetical protein
MNEADIKKWATLAAFVGLQVVVGIVYKFSQKASSSYSYSTFSALAMAEGTKIVISSILRY